MNLTELTQLNEMGRAKVCPTCGNTMSGFHYWYKGAWKCKSSSLSGGSTPTPAPTAAPVTPGTSTPAPAPAHKAATRLSAAATTPADQAGGWLKKHGVTEYTTGPDGVIHTKGDVHLDEFNNTQLPVTFGNVDGDFSMIGGSLTTLKGSPRIVKGSFAAHHNNLTTLEGGPVSVGEEADEHGLAYYDISHNEKLTSLDGLPQTIYGSLVAVGLKGITSLRGIHKVVKVVRGTASFTDTPLESHVLGLMLIRGLTEVNLSSNHAVAEIINKHLQGDRDLNMCQEELIDAGFSKFAKL